MVTPNERMLRSCWRAVAGTLPLPEHAGWCLQLVRLVVEDAFDLPAFGWYAWRTLLAGGRHDHDTTPWARDMERSLRAAGMLVPLPRYGSVADPQRYALVDEAEGALPGDLLFRWDTGRDSAGAYVGHVGVLLPHGLVLENINPAYRSARTGVTRGVTRVGALSWGVTSVVRFDPSVPPAPA